VGEGKERAKRTVDGNVFTHLYPARGEKLMELTYVSEAEKVIKNLRDEGRGRIAVTTSQIRQILTQANMIHNRIMELELNQDNFTVLPDEVVRMILGMEVKLVYQAGRSPDVKTFIEKSKLKEQIQAVGRDKEKFKLFFAYLEALVAYHRFYGGKE
jgi:CRISPR-associated protein Csm2